MRMNNEQREFRDKCVLAAITGVTSNPMFTLQQNNMMLDNIFRLANDAVEKRELENQEALKG